MSELQFPQTTSCPFCDYVRGTADAVFVSRGRTTSVLVNPRQYERGALLVIPNRHASTLIHADDESFLGVQLEARRMARLLVERFGATGVNVFQNAGESAGQTVPHYHVHVVPRYPSSDPARRFREADYGVTSNSELQAIADVLRPEGLAPDGQSKPVYETHPWWVVMFVGWMIVAFAAMARVIAAPDIAFDWPRAVPINIQLGALIGMRMSTRANGKRGMFAWYFASLALLAVSVSLTL